MQSPPRRRRRRFLKPRLTRALILKWSVAHHRRTGRWATRKSGPVVGVPGEYWQAIDHCLRQGFRGLAGGSSLARLLAEAGLRANRQALPPLQVERILFWAVEEYQSTGKWPTRHSGRVAATPRESWLGIADRLRRGGRGLPGGATLAGVLRLYRDILARAHWGVPLSDGQKTVETPEKLVALLVARGALREPELMKTLRERQREFRQHSLTDNKSAD